MVAGPSLEELNAAMLQYLSVYMWEYEALILKKHEDFPCPWIQQSPVDDTTASRTLWAQFRHEGSIEDEWFTVFLLSYLTDRFKVCADTTMLTAARAQLCSVSGYFSDNP
jgi:hypothetical protein